MRTYINLTLNRECSGVKRHSFCATKSNKNALVDIWHLEITSLTGVGVPGENSVRWYYGVLWDSETIHGLVGRVRSLFLKAVPLFFSLLLTALMDQSLGGVFLNKEMGTEIRL